jgi:hypothetical protein
MAGWTCSPVTALSSLKYKSVTRGSPPESLVPTRTTALYPVTRFSLVFPVFDMLSLLFRLDAAE